MEKIERVVGDNIFDIASTILKKIEKNNFDKKNIVLVPNEFQNICQKMLLEVLKEKAIFNVKITTILQFAKQTLNCQNKLLSLEKQFLVRQAIKNCQNTLQVMKGEITFGFVESVMKEIERFQESCVTPEVLKKLAIKDKFLQQKIFDLATIFEEYLHLEKPFDQFEIKENFLLLNQNFGDCNFFVVGFSHFAPIDEKVLKTLGATANKMFVGICKSKPNARNNYIYPENLIFENAKVENCEEFISQNQRILKDNLFGVEIDKTLKLDFLNVVEALNANTETQNVACQIKKLIVDDGATLRDIAIICGDIEGYKKPLSFALNQFGFLAYFDANESLKEVGVANFLLSSLNLCYEKTPEVFLKAATSHFTSFLSKKEKTALCEYFEQNEIENVQNIFENTIAENAKNKILNKLPKDLNKLPSEVLKEIILNFDVSSQIASMQQNKEKNLSAINKIIEICEVVEKYENDKKVFLQFFENCIKTSSIRWEDEKVDSIFVGGINSLCPTRKFVFVLGANEGVLPTQTSDTAILNDENLKDAGLNKILSALNQNKISRFDVFSNLINFGKTLTISYSLTDAGGKKMLPSGFLDNLISVDEKKLKRLSKFSDDGFEKLTLTQKAKVVARAMGTKQNAMLEVLKNDASENFALSDLMPSLKKATNLQEEKTQIDQISKNNLQELCFENNKTKISQIEAYYSCPFKHFLSYGLKLKEKDDKKLSTKEFGNVLHKVCELFLKNENNFVEKLKNFGVEKIVEEIFLEIKKDESFKQLFFEINKNSLLILKSEAKRLCLHLAKVQQKSNFHPKFFELYFGGEENKFEMNILDQNFSLVGVVDRVDVFNNNAVIIDYKTSSSIKGSCDELFYGEKIQIFVYAKALECLKNLNVQGVFYMPILNSFSDTKSLPYFLRGKDIGDEEFLLNFDKTLNEDNKKSSFFPCELKSGTSETGEHQFTNRSFTHTKQEEFAKMLDYSIEMVKGAIKEIIEGSTSVNPNESACQHCPYLSICNKPADFVERKRQYEISNSTFLFNKEKKSGD